MATGHIRKRQTSKGVTYQIIVEGATDPISGHRDRHYESTKGTKKQAEQRMRELIAQLEGGGITKESPILLSSWLQEFIQNYKPNIEATTRAGYVEKVKNCITPYIGHLQLRAINPNVVQKWANDLSKDGAAPKTVRNAFNILNAALKKARRISMISDNPCEGVELPKLKKYEAQVYDAEDIRKALAAASGTDMFLPLALLSSTGLRRGELCALTWEHIDLNAGILHVRENTVLANGEKQTKAPKTSAGTRDIPLGTEILAILRSAKAQYNEDKLRMGPLFHDGGYVIHKENGEQYRPDSLTQKWERFLERNHLPKIRLHDLRHSHATALIAAGTSAKVVQQRLGHSDVTTTLNIYTHATKEMNKAAADQIDSLIFGKASGE